MQEKNIHFNVYIPGATEDDAAIFFAENVPASSAEEAIKNAGAEGMDGVKTIAVHYIGEDGLEYDFR